VRVKGEGGRKRRVYKEEGQGRETVREADKNRREWGAGGMKRNKTRKKKKK